MEHTARIPNPVTGWVDDGAQPGVSRPVTTAMVVGRYLLALLIPCWTLAFLHAGDSGVSWWMWGAFLVVLTLVSALAHGSWWRASSSPGWTAAMIAESILLFGGMILAILWQREVLIVTGTLMIGAVLGAAATHAWRVLQKRRR